MDNFIAAGQIMGSSDDAKAAKCKLKATDVRLSLLEQTEDYYATYEYEVDINVMYDDGSEKSITQNGLIRTDGTKSSSLVEHLEKGSLRNLL